MMCSHAAPSLADLMAKRPSPAGAASLDGPTTGSRRRRLWELPAHCHCPVVGVGLPLATLRRLVGKACGGQVQGGDYTLHSGAVAESRTRNRVSELLQRELDTRHAAAIRRFAAAKSPAELLRMWHLAVADGATPGAFWAGLTHPRCDAATQDVLCNDMHMLQHQAGANVQVDLAKLDALLAENGVLARELARVQERSTRQAAEHARGNEEAHTQLALAHTALVAKDTQIAFLRGECEALRHGLPDLEPRQRLREQLDHALQLLTATQEANTVLRRKVAASELAASTPAATAMSQPQAAAVAQPIQLFLRQKTVLCVGGRTGNVADYRDLIERVGGRFAHHDGGLEDSHALLDSSLATADLVICQTGCISHNAYWRVKDFCRRTGKRCLFVESASTSALERSLNGIAADVPI